MRLTTSIFRLVHYRKDARRIGYVGQVYREVLHQFVEILELPVEYQRKISRAQKSSEQLHASQPERFRPLTILPAQTDLSPDFCLRGRTLRVGFVPLFFAAAFFAAADLAFRPEPIKNSSIEWPSLIRTVSHRGVAPRPAHVSPRARGTSAAPLRPRRRGVICTGSSRGSAAGERSNGAVAHPEGRGGLVLTLVARL